jgi:murein DD-endopeptidase MepM/ murein hydrolase activator NlpD
MKTPFSRPVKRFYLSQRFGENKVCVHVYNGDFILCDGTNPPGGYKSVYGRQGHLGIDIPARRWTPIVAGLGGKVIHIDTNEKSGFDVRIRSVADGEEYTHIYEHMVKWNVEIGETVEKGQLIGWVGSTGYSTGPHLHWQIMDQWNNALDPLTLVDGTYAGDWYAIGQTIKSIRQMITIIQGSITRLLSKG